MARKIKLREANIYGGVQLSHSNSHVTYNYSPGSKDEELLPEGIKEGDNVYVILKGLYADNDGVVAFHVDILTEEDNLLRVQKNGMTQLHITITSGQYVPVVAGQRLTEILMASTRMEQKAKSMFYTEFKNSLIREGHFKIFRNDGRMMKK